MNYELIHQNSKGKKHHSHDAISYLAFIKHATFAGMNSSRSPYLPSRYASLFFEFMPTLFGSGKFERFPELASDPTETAYLSNKIGRAFADYFSKKEYGAKFTHSYECAMALGKHSLCGERPDFYCDTGVQQFAVEAKGYSAASVSDNAMIKHKAQSGTGPLPVHFSVASVAYGLYKSPKIKFYDPVSGEFPYASVLNSMLRTDYYESVIRFVELIAEPSKNTDFPGFVFYRLPLASLDVRHILLHESILDRQWDSSVFFEEISPSYERDVGFYIDVDGIGLTKR